MGPDDRPFSERHWGFGRSLRPSACGRKGCVILLVGALAFVVLTFVIAAIVALF